MDVLECCGQGMDIAVDGGRFAEVHCAKCGDVVYVNKNPDAVRMHVLGMFF